MQKIELTFSQYDPSMEDRYTIDVPVNHKPVSLVITETTEEDKGGPDTICSHKAFVLVYDVTSISSFEHIPIFRNEIQEAKNLPRSPQLDVLGILVGNKADDKANRKVSQEDGETMACQLGCMYIEVSAKDGRNVDCLFYYVAALVQISHMEKALWKDLNTSQRRWHQLLSYLEQQILLAQSKETTTKPVPFDQLNIAMEESKITKSLNSNVRSIRR